MSLRASLPIGVLIALISPSTTATYGAAIDNKRIEGVVSALTERHGASLQDRIRRGATQVAERWWPEDGDRETYQRFCVEQFIAEESALHQAFMRLQTVVEQIDGHLHEIRRELTRPMELDTGEVGPVDQLLGDLDLSAHVNEDLYATKVAFLALLNFPVHSFNDRLEHSAGWDRETWARSRMMDRFAMRVPAEVSQEITRAFTRADQYVANYNIRMDRLVAADGRRPFPEGLRLITHWGLRDELKSQYAEPDGLAKQRMIQQVMKRIVRQEIPAEVIDNPDRVWNPDTLKVWAYDAKADATGEAIRTGREPDTRYVHFGDVYRAVRMADVYSPTAPTFIDRRFDIDREIPEEQVRALLVSVLTSTELKDLAAVIRGRLGRPLEAFDIWYNGFSAKGDHGEQELDEIVAARYPNVESFQGALPGILTGLGFSGPKAAWLSERIKVDPSRGAGHAMGAARREDKAHLRTRFGEGGMDYKGYNIAIHELGHNVEQVFSLNGIDHWWLNGVPNTAFTEALAFVFQNRDLELLGLASPGPDVRHNEALSTLWSTAEIGGVALVDMQVWRWMYDHPDATAAELREATLEIARKVWNRYFAPVFGVRDQEILAIYSHMIVYGLYLPDYPLGHIIAFQIADELRRGDFGEQFERFSRQGRLTPDTWMRGAVRQPISARALLDEARKALDAPE